MSLKESYCEGPTETALLEMTMGEALDHAALHFPDREAFVYVFQNKRITFKAFHEQVRTLAGGLVSCGLQAGDRVAVWTDVHHMELELLAHAVLYAGLVLVGTFLQDLKEVIDDMECKAIIYPKTFWEIENHEDKISECVHVNSKDVKQHDKTNAAETSVALLPQREDMRGKVVTIEKLAELGENAWENNNKQTMMQNNKCTAADYAVIMLTSGTTGKPKGVTSSHRSMVNNGFFMGERLLYSKKAHRICSLMQRYDDIGMVEDMCSFMHGATIVVPERQYDIEDIVPALAAIEQERCTAIHAFPSYFIDIINHRKYSDYNLKTLYTGFTCAAPMFSKKMQEILKKFAPDLVPGYGTTETKRNIQGFVTDTNDKRAHTIGYPMPHTKVKIVDEDGVTVAIGDAGELCLHTYSTMSKYWNQEEKTSQAIDTEGWYHTGDLASMEGDGYVKIVGRIKDQICTEHTDMIYAAEVENIILLHPDVEDVAVVGVVDPQGRGEEICAVVKVKPGQHTEREDILTFLLEKNWECYKTPRHILFTETFPLNKRGKKIKSEIRNDASRRLNRLTLEDSFKY